MIKDVREYFITRVRAITNIPTVYTDGENVTVKGQQDFPFIRYTFMPREGRIQDLPATRVSAAGLIRLDVYYSRHGDNINAAYDMADAIVANFAPLLTDVAGDQITIDLCWSEQLRHEPSAVNIPVYIRWNTFTA